MGCCPSSCTVEKADKKVQVPSACIISIPTTSISYNPPPPDSYSISLISYEHDNIRTTYKDIFKDIDYADILDIMQEVTNIVNKKLSSLKISNKDINKEQMPDIPFKDQYFAHGEYSDIVADVNSERHGCIKSSESIDIKHESIILSELNDEIEKFLISRMKNMTTREQTTIDQHIQSRNTIIKAIFQKGNSYTQSYEKEYQRLLETYISRLELSMIQVLDELHKNIQIDQQTVIIESQRHIEDLTFKAQQARQDLMANIYLVVNQLIRQIFSQTEEDILNMKHQPLGLEELRTINLRVYSTVGENDPKNGCNNIPNRDEYIKDINDKKAQHPIKRTVYLGSNPNITIPR